MSLNKTEITTQINKITIEVETETENKEIRSWTIEYAPMFAKEISGRITTSTSEPFLL